MDLVLSILIPVLFALIAFEGSTRLTYGPLLKEVWLDGYIKTRLPNLRLNFYTPSILTDNEYPFIAKSMPALTSKWYIDGIGRIPRWSKWSKILDKRRMELLRSQ